MRIKGINIHPGLSKNQMKNSILIANKFMNMLPAAETPSHTENYEGYFHILDFHGEVEQSLIRIYIRDFDRAKFEGRKKQLQNITEYLNHEFGNNTVSLEIEDTYYNMAEKILPNIQIIKAIEEGMKKTGVEPCVKPIRGGTDGSVLSQLGIPTPNLCSGSHNCHGRYEYVSIQSMEKIVQIIVHMVESFTA